MQIIGDGPPDGSGVKFHGIDRIAINAFDVHIRAFILHFDGTETLNIYEVDPVHLPPRLHWKTRMPLTPRLSLSKKDDRQRV